MNPTPYWILRHHGSSSIRSLHYHTSSNLLAVGDDSGTVSFVDLATLRPRWKWTAHSDSLLTVLMISRKFILTHARDNTLKLWHLSDSLASLGATAADWTQPDLVRTIGVNALNFSKCSYNDGRVAVPNALDAAYVDIINIHTGIREHEAIGKPDIKAPSGNRLPIVMTLHLLPEKSGVIAGYEDGWVKKWTLKGELEWKQQCHSESIMSVDLCQKQAWGVSVGADDRLARFNLTPEEEDQAVNLRQTKHAGNASIAIAPDAKTVVVGGWDGSIRVFDARQAGRMPELGSLSYHRDTVECLTFAYAKTQEVHDEDDSESEDSETDEDAENEQEVIKQKGRELILAAGGRDGKISLWKYH